MVSSIMNAFVVVATILIICSNTLKVIRLNDPTQQVFLRIWKKKGWVMYLPYRKRFLNFTSIMIGCSTAYYLLWQSYLNSLASPSENPEGARQSVVYTPKPKRMVVLMLYLLSLAVYSEFLKSLYTFYMDGKDFFKNIDDHLVEKATNCLLLAVGGYIVFITIYTLCKLSDNVEMYVSYAFIINFLLRRLVARFINSSHSGDIIDNPSLEKKIKDIAEKAGLKRESIGIKKQAANYHKPSHTPYIVGFGRIKYVLFNSASFEYFAENELVAIAAHKIAHWAKGYSAAKLLINVFDYLQYALIFKKMMVNRRTKSGFALCYMQMVSFLIAYSEISDFIINVIFKMFINSADNFVVKAGYGEALKRAIMIIKHERIRPLFLFKKYFFPEEEIENWLERLECLQSKL